MKHNYKIRLDQPPPSDEQIARHRNFDRILADYHNLTQPIYRRPLYKNPKAFIGLVLILAIGFLVFEAVDEERKKIAEQEIPEEIRQAEQNAFLEPALSSYSVPYQSFAAPTGEGGPIELENGLRIEVPASAFALPDGSPVANEDVRISLRCIQDPYDMILAGIPMHTFRGEKPVQLEADLILDIRAEANGQPLSLVKDKQLTVLLPASTQAPARDLKLYQMDTLERHWFSLEPGYEVLERPLADRSMVTNLPTSDGMEMLEFDEEGNVLEVRDTFIRDSSATAKQFQRRLELSSLGLFGLERPLENPARNSSAMRTVKIRLDHPGLPPMKVHTLYKVVRGLNTVAYYWPRDEDLSYELSFVPGLKQAFFGINEDGELISVDPADLEKLDQTNTVHTVPHSFCATPVKNKEHLKQLIEAKLGQ